MYRKNKSINRLKHLKYRNIYIKIDRNRMLDIVIHYSYVWNLSLYRSTSFTTGDQSGDRRDRDLCRSRSIRSQYPRNDGRRDASSDRLMFLREETATKRACELTRTTVFPGCIKCESRCLRLTAVEMSGSEYGASKIISTNHFISQVMRAMVPARFKYRKRAGVYFKREVRCRHPVAQ